MSNKVRVVSVGGTVAKIRPTTEYDADGFFLSGHSSGQSSAERKKAQVLSRTPGRTTPPGQLSSYSGTERNLTPLQNYTLYMKTPDIRAAVDAIVRRVATWDWSVEPTADPSGSEYDEHAKVAEEVVKFLKMPNENRQTWQEMMTQMVTDLMLYDSGVIELVGGADADLDTEYEVSEVIPWLGSEFLPWIDEFGYTVGYKQEQERILGAGVPISGPQHGENDSPEIDFTVNQLCFFRLFTNSRSPIGVPLMETIINEAITLLLSSEMSMMTMDADEIPPGLLVLGGLAGAAADRARADLQSLRGKDHKIRVIASPTPGAIDAKWVELRKTPKELTMLEVVESMRRMIWRVFGVMPVEMGATDQMPRATAMVQMDVSSSHLITPILELIQAKFNGEIIHRLVSPEYAGKLRFVFDRSKTHSPDEQLKVANRHDVYMRRGVMTINEVRSELGMLPVDGGDVIRTDTPGYGPVPLSQLSDFIAAQLGDSSFGGGSEPDMPDEDADSEPEQEEVDESGSE